MSYWLRNPKPKPQTPNRNVETAGNCNRTLEALRDRWDEGSLIVDGKVLTESGIVTVNALPLVPGAGGEEGESGPALPPEGYMDISRPGRPDLSMEMMGSTVGMPCVRALSLPLLLPPSQSLSLCTSVCVLHITLVPVLHIAMGTDVHFSALFALLALQVRCRLVRGGANWIRCV